MTLNERIAATAAARIAEALAEGLDLAPYVRQGVVACLVRTASREELAAWLARLPGEDRETWAEPFARIACRADGPERIRAIDAVAFLRSGVPLPPPPAPPGLGHPETRRDWCGLRRSIPGPRARHTRRPRRR